MFDVIAEYTHECDIAIVALTETWLTNGQKDAANISKLTPDEYILFYTRIYH